MSNNEMTDEQADRMLKAIFNQKPNNKTVAVIIHDAEEKDFPASMNVLRMSRVENQIHLTVCKEQDINGSFTYTPVNQMAFDLDAFVRAVGLVLDEVQEA